MSAPFEPEAAREDAPGAPEVPVDDLLVDAATADGEPDDEAAPDEEPLAAPRVRDDADEDALDDAAAADAPQGYRTPEAGGGITAAELRSDLTE